MHSAKGAESSLHSNVTRRSDDENSNVASSLLMGSRGFLVIVVSGSSVSIRHVQVAGAASALPAASRARTWKVCVPSASDWELGEVQVENEPASTLHSKVEPGSVEVKVKSASPLLLGSGGPVSILVSGSTVSIVQVCEAGVSSA